MQFVQCAPPPDCVVTGSAPESHLGLAGSGGDTVGLGASSDGTVGLALDRGGGEVGERGLAHSSQALASSGLATALVSGEVERDEEDQVRADDAHAGEGGKLLTSAAAGIGHPGEVGGGEVGVRREVDKA